jgi:hypothetical protein
MTDERGKKQFAGREGPFRDGTRSVPSSRKRAKNTIKSTNTGDHCGNMHTAMNQAVRQRREEKLALHQSKLMGYPDGRHSDGNNLYLIVSNNGSARSFMYRSNKYRRGLGSARIRTLAEARQMALEILKQERDGKDPKVERENARLDQEIAKGLARTFREVAEEFVEKKLAHKQPRTIKRNRMLLRNHVLPKIGDMLTGQITQTTILKDMDLEKLWVKKTPTADRVRGLSSAYSTLRSIADIRFTFTRAKMLPPGKVILKTS